MRRLRVRALGGAVLLLASVLVACSSSSDAPASNGAGTTTSTVPPNTAPCEGPDGVGGTVPAGLGPGDLVAAVDLTPQSAGSPGFPSGARVWRVLYVSTGVDENDLQLICGMVAAPQSGPSADAGRGHLLAWSHGTIGLAQRCLPSSDPATFFWGPMAGGIGAISWGTGPLKHDGQAKDGLLQYAMNQGWVVAASDYQPTDTYIVGKIAAGNQLDVTRAASQLMTKEFPPSAPTEYDLIVSGHSQGGHAAMWTGQLAESYLAATKPSQPTASLALKGVSLLAPATNFIAQPARQQGVALGDGLVDWEMHQAIEPLGVPLPELEVQIGPALFAYVFGSWSQLSSAAEQPGPSSKFPAFPIDTPIALTSVATPDGVTTVNTVQALCLAKSDGKAVDAATSQYHDAKTNQMLLPALWNLPADYKTGEYFKGGLDSACSTSTDPGLTNWCSWIRWNLPGPLGANPYPKAPMSGGQPVPIYIAQGGDDTIIHCVSPKDTDDQVPSPADCMARAFYDSLSSEVYCPASGNVGYLKLDVFRKDDLDSPASHLSIPGEASAKGLSKSDLVFDGSPVQQFMSGAFAGSLAPGCGATVPNK